MSVDYGITIRPMQEEDIPAVHAIDVLSFALPWPKRSYEYELKENPGSILSVAESATHEIVGMVITWLVIDEAHIATIAVHPDWRGHGIGRRLLAVTLVEAYRRGMLSAILEVRAGNTLAQTMYAEFGFRVVGRRPGYYQDNHEDAILMTLKDLNLEYVESLEKRYLSGQQAEMGQKSDVESGDS